MPQLFTVTFRGDLMATGVKNKLGQFTSFQTNMREAYQQMATNAAVRIKEALQAHIEDTGRPQVARIHRGQGAEALLDAIVNKDNRTWGFGGFTVMRPEFLEGLVVNEYYRGLEIGSDRLVGRRMAGYFIIPGAALASEGLSRTQAVLVQLPEGQALPGKLAQSTQARTGKGGPGSASSVRWKPPTLGAW